MKLTCSLAKRFGDAESCAQCPIYYDQRPVCFADRTICRGVYRSVSLNDELPNLPPNSYGTLAKRKREKVYNKPVIFQWPQQVNIRYSFIAASMPVVSTNITESTNTEP